MSYSIVVTLVALAAGGVAYMFGKRARAQAKRATVAEAAVKQRDHTIARIQEVNRETEKQRAAIRTGSPDQRFDASLGIMRDDPGRAPRKPGA